jgi:hypothetical protein
VEAGNSSRSLVTHGLAFAGGGVLVLLFFALRPTGSTATDSRRELGGLDDSTATASGRSPTKSSSVAPRGAAPANVEALRQRIEELEGKLAATEVERAAGEERIGGDVTYFNLTREELVAMAKRCETRSDIPGDLDDERAADMGMSAEERQAYDRALKRWREAYERELTMLYEEATGEPMPDDPLAAIGAFAALRQESDRDLRRHMAEERAGLREHPGSTKDQTLYERHTRLSEGRGDAFEAVLAEELGPTRARELRAANDGWPGGRQRHMGCPD